MLLVTQARPHASGAVWPTVAVALVVRMRLMAHRRHPTHERKKLHERMARLVTQSRCQRQLLGGQPQLAGMAGMAAPCANGAVRRTRAPPGTSVSSPARSLWVQHQRRLCRPLLRANGAVRRTRAPPGTSVSSPARSLWVQHQRRLCRPLLRANGAVRRTRAPPGTSVAQLRRQAVQLPVCALAVVVAEQVLAPRVPGRRRPFRAPKLRATGRGRRSRRRALRRL
jgi:hypothetical protein